MKRINIVNDTTVGHIYFIYFFVNLLKVNLSAILAMVYLVQLETCIILVLKRLHLNQQLVTKTKKQKNEHMYFSKSIIFNCLKI